MCSTCNHTSDRIENHLLLKSNSRLDLLIKFWDDKAGIYTWRSFKAAEYLSAGLGT